MKLLDFEQNNLLNELRLKMSAPLVDWNFHNWVKIDKNGLRNRLSSLEGIEVNIEDIVPLSDGTFEYKGHKVLVYIRDQYQSSRGPRKEYKFHIANCSTMAKAFSTGRMDRYVVSTRTDGRFLVNIREWPSGQVLQESAILELHVCKNCLATLKYQGYTNHRRHVGIYSSFSLSAFFEAYGKDQIRRLPRYTDIDAPNDQYTNNFEQVSKSLKESCGWVCERCKRNYSDHKEFLHTHHINGVKGDNSINNLTVLCVWCHAMESRHEHLRFSPIYRKYLQIFGRNDRSNYFV